MELFIRYKGEIKIFLEKQKLKEFITPIEALQKMLKGLIRTDVKILISVTKIYTSMTHISKGDRIVRFRKLIQ